MSNFVKKFLGYSIIQIFSILHFLSMKTTTNPNNANIFPNSLPLYIYKHILLFT